MTNPFGQYIPVYQPWDRPAEALQRFLQDVNFTVGGDAEDEGLPLTSAAANYIENNLFIDFLPRWLYDKDDEAYIQDPGKKVVVRIVEEPQGASPRTESHNHKLVTGVVFDVFGGARYAARDAERLHRFFLLQGVGFETATLRVLRVVSSSEPALVGVEGSGWSNFQFRVTVWAVALDSP
jgi:hypothetical protein